MEKFPKGKRVKLNLTIDCDLKAVLVELASSEGRDVSWIVERAILDCLKARGREVPLQLRTHLALPVDGPRR
jgi:hypothetical protein